MRGASAAAIAERRKNSARNRKNHNGRDRRGNKIEKKARVPRPDPTCGMTAMYQRGCRCEDCKRANREYMAQYRADRREPLTDEEKLKIVMAAGEIGGTPDEIVDQVLKLVRLVPRRFRG